MTEKTLLKEYTTVSNAIITLGDTDVSGKGRHFKSRFIQPGLAGYPGQYGNALIKKENLDKFIHTLRNKPVTINHKDNIGDDDKVGEVLNVWYNPEDGWYWCDGIITDETAINLINDKNWSVSCSYDFTKYDDEGGTENNIPYDIEFLDGEFNHLAIVDNPRYEGANIVFNSKGINTQSFKEQFIDSFYEALAEVIVENCVNNDKWITVHPHGKGSKGIKICIRDGETFENALGRLKDSQKKQGYLYDKKTEAWDILSQATGKPQKWLKMRYKKNYEKIQDLIEGTDRIDGYPAKYYVELLKTSYDNNYGNESVGIGEKVAQQILDDLYNDNFYDEVYLKEQEEERYYQEQYQDKLKIVKSKIKSQFVKDLLKDNENLSSEIYNIVTEKMDKTEDIKEYNKLLEDFKILETLEDYIQ